jgi:hypothetical protein
MIYPGTESTGGYSMGGSPDDLEERKRKLVERLLQQGAANQTGLSGLRSLPLFGGRGRGSTDAPNAALPALTFNPFLAMAAGRGAENFQAPNGITAQALAQAQAGLRGPIGGPAPQQAGGNGDQAASAFLGAGASNPGVNGPAAITAPKAAAAYTDPQAYLLQGASGVRHLTGGNPNTVQPVPRGFIPRLGSFVAM